MKIKLKKKIVTVWFIFLTVIEPLIEKVIKKQNNGFENKNVFLNTLIIMKFNF